MFLAFKSWVQRKAKRCEQNKKQPNAWNKLMYLSNIDCQL